MRTTQIGEYRHGKEGGGQGSREQRGEHSADLVWTGEGSDKNPFLRKLGIRTRKNKLPFCSICFVSRPFFKSKVLQYLSGK